MLCNRLSQPASHGARSIPWRRPSARHGRFQLRVAQPKRADGPLSVSPKRADGPSTDLRVILSRLISLGLPYWQSDSSARWKLAGVVGLTLATTGVSVVFNFLGRDFFTALSEKDEVAFRFQLVKYLAGFALGIPVFVFKSYYQSKLALEWRQWLTERLLSDYLSGTTFYGLQQSGEVDNPDQRLAADVATFTDTATGLSLTLLNASLDLLSFAGILASIYPPLFAALVVYALGGTAASVALGKNLVTLNFNQEAREADLRYGLVRVRENAESIAFYGGSADERELLRQRLQAAVENYLGLLTASRNLDFFTSFYRYLIQLLPAAVVAPLYFQGKIDFGVINQSQSAFNHILNDVSLVIYQIEALAGFSAVVDRLGEFQEAMAARQDSQQAQTRKQLGTTPLQQAGQGGQQEEGQQQQGVVGDEVGTTDTVGVGSAARSATVAAEGWSEGEANAAAAGTAAAALADGEIGVDAFLSGIELRFQGDGGMNSGSSCVSGGNGNNGNGDDRSASGKSVNGSSGSSSASLLRVRELSVVTPRGGTLLLRRLNLEVPPGSSLLIMGPSGTGKTSLLRAVAGLWSEGAGSIHVGAPRDQVMFLPQRPYMVLGSLRDQVLYPRRRPGTGSTGGPEDGAEGGEVAAAAASSTGASSSSGGRDGGGGGSEGGRDEGRTTEEQGGLVLPSDSEVVAVLEVVQLGHLLKRYGRTSPSHTNNGNGTSSSSSSSSSPTHSIPALDVLADWSASLSLGEQQRLGWARLLLTRPRLALLDEATSALDQDTEARLYTVLRQSGITFISVGHRSTLREFHNTLLQLRPDPRGGVAWEVRQLAPAADTVAAVK